MYLLHTGPLSGFMVSGALICPDSFVDFGTINIVILLNFLPYFCLLSSLLIYFLT